MDERDHIGFELRLIHNLIRERMKENRERDGLHLTQLQHLIIRYLDENQDREVYQKDLEEAFHTSRATISNTLQIMERDGLVKRSSVSSDARLKCLSLTKKSVEFTRKARENVEQMEILLRSGMSEEERKMFMIMLRRIRENLERDRAECLERREAGLTEKAMT